MIHEERVDRPRASNYARPTRSGGQPVRLAGPIVRDDEPRVDYEHHRRDGAPDGWIAGRGPVTRSARRQPTRSCRPRAAARRSGGRPLVGPAARRRVSLASRAAPPGSARPGAFTFTLDAPRRRTRSSQRRIELPDGTPAGEPGRPRDMCDRARRARRHPARRPRLRSTAATLAAAPGRRRGCASRAPATGGQPPRPLDAQPAHRGWRIGTSWQTGNWMGSTPRAATSSRASCGAAAPRSSSPSPPLAPSLIGVVYPEPSASSGVASTFYDGSSTSCTRVAPFIFVVIFLITIINESAPRLRGLPGDRPRAHLLRRHRRDLLADDGARRARAGARVKNAEFIEGRASSARRTDPVRPDVCPTCGSIVIVYLTLTIPAIMLFEAFLSFLGPRHRAAEGLLGPARGGRQGRQPDQELLVARRVPPPSRWARRCSRSTCSATACATRSTRRCGEGLMPLLEVKNLRTSSASPAAASRSRTSRSWA